MSLTIGGGKSGVSDAAVSLAPRFLYQYVVVAALLLALLTNTAAAQDDDDLDLEFATGAILPTAEEVARLPAAPLTRAFLPELVDLSSRMPPVGDQGRLGSCVSWAVGYATRSYYSKLERQGRLTNTSIPSPSYMHGILRVPDEKGKWRCDGGAYIHEAIDLLQNEGAASLAQVAYTDQSCAVPNAELRDTVRSTSTLRVSSSRVIPVREEADLDKIKAELARGHSVITGVDVNREFFRLRGRQVWNSKREPEGGHAITLVGYNEKGQYFKFINSWGSRWGDRGYGRLAYDALLNQPGGRQTVGYSIRVEGAEPPEPQPEPGPAPTPPIAGEIALPEVSCGMLSQQRVDGKHTIAGFVREEADLDKLRTAIEGKDIQLDVALRPWPQCEALMTLRDPLTDSGKPVVELPQESYAEGDTLSFSVGMAPFEGYLHVAYVQADGNVVNLVQQGVDGIRTLDRGTTLTFGDGENGRAKFTVSEPYGKEMVIAISSASPLFPRPRPTVEVEREFLTALRGAILARPDPNLPERRISAAYAILETKGTQP